MSVSGIGEKGAGGDGGNRRSQNYASSPKSPSLLEETPDEDVIIPNTSFRTTSFGEVLKPDSFDYTAHAGNEPPRLFSLGGRSPM